MPNENIAIIITIVTTTLLILILFSFIVTILFVYQKKQINYQKNIDGINFIHEKNILSSKLEIQEQTFQNISREIHDNIGLNLTLAKLNLNTLQGNLNGNEKIISSIELIGKVLNDLNDISKSLNPEVVNTNGLLKVLEMDVNRINKTGIYKIDLQISGEVKFLQSSKELIIYRIAQEALQNSIKHSKAKNVIISLHYESDTLYVKFCDDGVGFANHELSTDLYVNKSVLNNIRDRTKLIAGTC